MFKYLYYFCLAFVLVFLAQSVFTASEFFLNLNLLLVFLVFVTIIFGFNFGFTFALFLGFIQYFYSYLPFGTHIAIYLLIILGVNFLYKNVLINFSLNSAIILTFLATLIYNLLIVVFSLLNYIIGQSSAYILLDTTFGANLFWQVLLNLSLISIVFFIAKFTIKRLNLVFLIKK